MLEANFRRPQAKFIFLAVASLKHSGIEIADLIQTIPSDVHAKAHGRGQFDAQTRIGFGEGAIQRRQRPTRRQRVGVIEARITANGAVVGERGDRTHPRGAVSTAAQPIQPIAVNLGIAVEQHHIAVGVQDHPAIDGVDETGIDRIDQQRDRAGLRQIPQPRRQRRFRTAIVHHDDFTGGALWKRQHAFQTAPGLSNALVDRDDDIHQGCLSGWRL